MVADVAPAGFEIREVPLQDLLVARAVFSYASGRSPEDSVLPGDDDPRAVHLLAVSHGVVAGAATLTWDPCEMSDGELVHWRLRALGVAPTAQRRGIGRALVFRRLRLVAERGADTAWCSAREQNVERFTRWGAVAMGPVVVPGTDAPAGTSHTLMRWAVGT